MLFSYTQTALVDLQRSSSPELLCYLQHGCRYRITNVTTAYERRHCPALTSRQGRRLLPLSAG